MRIPSPLLAPFSLLCRLKRGDDGKFSDDDIANILQTATETPACSYGSRGTPECMKVIEVMGLEQARKWGQFFIRSHIELMSLTEYAQVCVL